MKKRKQATMVPRYVVPSLRPNDQSGYFFYRKRRKIFSHVSENRTTFSKVVTAIFDAIGEVMLENEGGVFLKEYGYFSPILIRSGYKPKIQHDYYYHTNMEIYGLSFFPDTTFGSCLRGMSMDRTYSDPMKKAFTKATYEREYRPKLYYTLLKSLFGRRDSRK